MQDHIATPIGISRSDLTKRPCLMVRSLMDRDECRRRGFQHEWGLNLSQLLRSRDNAAVALGIDHAALDGYIAELQALADAP